MTERDRQEGDPTDSDPARPGTQLPTMDEDRRRTAATDLAGLLPSRVLPRQAYVVVLAGHQVGAVFRLASNEVTVGRSPECDITLIDDSVSRKHARLVRSGPAELTVEDLGSTNGTFVGNQRVESGVVRDGERFELGGTTLLKFTVSDELEESFQRRLFESSVRDALTGVFNRKHFDERLESEFSFATRHDMPLSIVILDLDHFKLVNDTHGHLAGDDVLRAVAFAVQRTIRAEDLFARIGGEEFGLLARKTAADQGVRLAERVRSVIERLTIPSGDKVLRITISAGVATYKPVFYEGPGPLVQAADKALYKAKALGRNKVIIAGT